MKILLRQKSDEMFWRNTIATWYLHLKQEPKYPILKKVLKARDKGYALKQISEVGLIEEILNWWYPLEKAILAKKTQKIRKRSISYKFLKQKGTF